MLEVDQTKIKPKGDRDLKRKKEGRRECSGRWVKELLNALHRVIRDEASFSSQH